MKKLLLFRMFALVTALACTWGASAANYNFSSDGIYYRLTTYNDGSGVISVENNGSFNTYSGYVIIPDSVEYNDVKYPVVGIGYQAFKDCTELTRVKMPEGITMLMNESFAGCTALTSITLPSTLQTIYYNAFTGCTELMTITCLRENPITCNENNFDSHNYYNTILYVPEASVSSYYSTSPWSRFQHIKPIVTLDEALNVEGGTIEFTSEGDFPWVVINEGGRTYAQSSNKGEQNSQSVLTATVTLDEPSALSFEFKAWGESGFYDLCEFSMDGVQKLGYGNYQNDWESYTLENIPAGTHTFTWSYTKDGSVNPEGDYFAIDNVKIVGSSLIQLNEALNVEGGNIVFFDEGDYPWLVIEEGDRIYAKSSNAGIPKSESRITASIHVDEASILSFDFKAWGETDPVYTNLNYDECVFMLNGISIFRYGARDNDWETFSVELKANNTYQVVWFYHKDETDDGVGDYFALDNIKVTPKSIRGDVNGDSSVNIADVTSLIDYLLSSNVSGIDLSAADCNEDSSINIADVTSLIDYLLSGSW